MSLEERANIIFTAWNLLAHLDDPMNISQETVHNVWKKCGIKIQEDLMGAVIT